jgi:hypothetical protein
MSKSIYEKYAEEEQPVKLASTMSLKEAVEQIRSYSTVLSEICITGMKLLVGRLWGLTPDEVDRLVAGDEYWIV